jgi:hypothetical protein
MAGTGTKRYCQCGETMAAINLAVSGTSTTTYCATGAAPTSFSVVPVSNGEAITTSSAEASPTSPATVSSVAPDPSASASASWASAVAVPSAGCWILADDGFGDSAFAVYGINGWAGDDGSALQNQENGCGIVSGWAWVMGGQDEFEGQLRSTEYATFGLSFFKGGCVERAVASAGGPPTSQLQCQHYPLEQNADASSKGLITGNSGSLGDKSQLKAVVNSITLAQVDSVAAMANSLPSTGNSKLKPLVRLRVTF